MTKHSCGEDELCENGLDVCCGVCPKKNICKQICYFFEASLDKRYEDCESLVTVLDKGVI